MHVTSFLVVEERGGGKLALATINNKTKLKNNNSIAWVVEQDLKKQETFYSSPEQFLQSTMP